MKKSLGATIIIFLGIGFSVGAYSQTPLTTADINVPNGVSGLNNVGSVTSPVATTGVDTPTYAAPPLLSTGRAWVNSMIDGTSLVRINAAHRQANPLGEDIYTDPEGVVIGGLVAGRGSHVVMDCQDEGGINLGACLSVWNSGLDYTGNRPGISPSDTGVDSSIRNYQGNFDSVVFDNGTKNSTPKIVLGQDVVNQDGQSRTLYFSSSSIWIYPALTVSQQGRIKQWQWIVSNVSTPVLIDRKNADSGQFWVNGFSGTIDNWNFSDQCPVGMTTAGGSAIPAGSTCSRLDVDNWQILGAGNAYSGLNPQNYAATASNIDRHYDQGVIHPAVYIGAAGKQFNLLDTCAIVDNDTVPSADSAHSLTRECENGEYDDELYTAISGKYRYFGLTLALDSHVRGVSWLDGTPQADNYNAWPTLDSRGIYLGGMLPNLLVLNPYSESFVKSIAGNTINIWNPISVGSSPGNLAMMESLFKNAGSSSMTLNTWQQCDAISGQTCGDYNSMSIRIGVRVGASIGDPASGAPAPYVKIGGNGYLSLCSASDICGVTVDPYGNEMLANNKTLFIQGGILQGASDVQSSNLEVSNIATIGTLNSNAATITGNLVARAFIGLYSPIGGGLLPGSALTMDSNGQWVIGGQIVSTPSVQSSGDVTVAGQLNLASKIYTQLGNTGVPGTQRFCSDCYSSLRASGSSATGMMVTWSGAAWVDGVGNPILH